MAKKKENQDTKYIGERKVKEVKKTEETTPGNTPIIAVTYEDGLVEHFSELMLDKVISNEPCNLTELRDKRVIPVMERVFMIMREWGLKTGEFPYFSQLLNQSLDFNTDAAYIKLVSKYMPKPLSLEDVDLIAIDRILRNGDTKQ